MSKYGIESLTCVEQWLGRRTPRRRRPSLHAYQDWPRLLTTLSSKSQCRATHVRTERTQADVAHHYRSSGNLQPGGQDARCCRGNCTVCRVAIAVDTCVG